MRCTKIIEKKNKLGQAEIIGITIVMVLIMIGIIFVIKYVVLPDDFNIKESYDKTQIAANFMDAMLKTTTNCNNLPMTELIQNCVEHYGSTLLYQCPADDALGICTGGCTSCEYVNQSISHILTNSLDKMPQISYDFFICKWDDANGECEMNDPANPDEANMISYFPKDNCTNLAVYKKYDQKQQPIPTNAGNRVAVTFVCSRAGI